jgi:hypothetical protein
VHAAFVAGQAGAADRDAQRRVDQGRAVDAAVHGVLDEHAEQGAQGAVVLQPVLAQRVAHGAGQVTYQQEVPRPDGPEVVRDIGRAAQGHPDARPTGRPEGLGQPVQQLPQRAMGRVVAEGSQSLRVPRIRVAVQRHRPVGQPGDVPGQRLAPDRRQPYRVEQFGADPAGFEVDQGRGSDVEREPAGAPVAGAPANVAVGLEYRGGQAGRLEPQRRGHAGQSTPDHRDVHAVGNG